MVSASLPFRVHLGSFKGNHSLVVHSSKGVNWHNVHPDLERLLQRIQSRDILDLSLGCEGRYWIKYSQGTTIQRSLALEAWNEIRPKLERRLKSVSRVSMGVDKEIWVLGEANKPPLHFVAVRPTVVNLLSPQGQTPPPAEDIGFVELGCSVDNYVVKVGTKVVLGRHKGIRGLTEDKIQNDRIVAAALSPLDNSHYFITFDDGSYRSSLPKALGKMVKPHLLQATPSLLRGNKELTIPHPLWLWYHIAGGSSLCVPPANDYSTQLRSLHQLDPKHQRVEELFRNTWKCPNRPCPPVRHIYEIAMPGSLVAAYCTYRLSILCKEGETNNMEELSFHGTSRLCSVGDAKGSSIPCKNSACRLCCILRNSFRVDQAGTVKGRCVPRFGKGIYTSCFSSKADNYIRNSSSPYKAMLVARAVLGTSCMLTSKKEPKPLLEPPAGYDSVLGRVGASQEYDVYTVYRDEAILPAYLIIYGQ